MANKLRLVLFPTQEELKEHEEKYLKLHEELSKEKGCSTCKNCIQIEHYPGFVTAEECKCTVGLECDTVFFTVKNCPKWMSNL